MNSSLPNLLLRTLLCIILSSHVALAQYPAVFSQFNQNPFQFNPSYAAGNGYTEANLFYRKQWMGIENAPEAAALNFQAPVGRNVSLGLSVISNKTILLNTYGAMATFAYRVRLSYQHHLNFGLSAGLGLNNFDFEAIAASNDPALQNVVRNSQYLTGQVGFNYTFKNFNIGFALPSIFDSKVNTVDDFQEVKFNVFNNKFGSASYTFALKDIHLMPTVIYRSLDNYQSQWEGMLLVTYKNFLWVGASYREEYGITGLIGVRLKNRLRVGYAYEYPTGSISRASTGSHEIYLGAQLGTKNREAIIHAQEIQRDSLERVAKLQQEQKATDTKPNVEERPVTEPAVQPQQEVKPVETQPEVTPQPVEPEQQTKQDEPMSDLMQKVDQVNTTPERTGYYLIVGVYGKEENALRNFSNLRSAGHNPQMMFVEEKGYFYIYLFHSANRIEAVRELEKVRSNNKFYGAWIYSPPPRK
ncbi:MAG: PorP/SprF family type IX secretion system membrane protein [Cyclobacteriaceae bacterium]|nr:PorP/SprF family type IX secretion system membrane protein [Cyclobacteriaceae bacterium]